MSELKAVLYDSREKVAALEADWERLLRSVPTHTGSQGLDYALCGWDTLSKDHNAKLAVVGVWRDATLVCAWPLYTVTRRGVRTACHLGCGDLHEYASPLVVDDDNAPEIVRVALSAVKTVADVVKVYNVRVPGKIAETLAAEPALKRRSSVGSPVVSLKGVPDWAAWEMTTSKKLRSTLRYDRKQLAKLGEVTFREMVGPVDGVRCMDWIFARKREWLVARNIRNSFFLNPQIEPFFMKLSERPPRADGVPFGVQTFALMLDDKITAACICLTSGDRLEFYTTTFDLEYSAYSTGSLMIQDCVTLAIKRGVDFDFRIAQQAYKMRWSDRFDQYDSFSIACSPLGVVAVAVEEVQSWVHRARVAYGPRIKALLGMKSEAQQHE